MAVLPIRLYGDPVLREVADQVAPSDRVRRLAADLIDTMYDAPGIGLAAIQVAEPLRVLVVDCTERAEREENGEEVDREREPAKEERNPIFMINPEIVATSEVPSTYQEGCLSIPDYYADVERPESCTVKYLDRDGKEQLIDATGLLATCVQHEIDHLNGKLFIDLLSKLKRDRVIKKFTKIAKQAGTLPEKRMIG